MANINFNGLSKNETLLISSYKSTKFLLKKKKNLILNHAKATSLFKSDQMSFCTAKFVESIEDYVYEESNSILSTKKTLQ